jgi:hypothetical protein
MMNDTAQPTDAQVARLENVLNRLSGVKPIRGGSWKYTARCPVHADREPSLLISLREDGSIGIHCFTGCTPRGDKKRLDAFLQALDLTYKDIAPEGYVPAQDRPQRPQDDSIQGCSLEDIITTKYIDPRVLYAAGVYESPYRGKTILHIPYVDALGVIQPRYRLRLSLDKGGRRFTWGGPQDAEPVAYGLQYLPLAQEKKYLVLVEGETDTWTLAMHNFPPLGLPGADMASKLRDEYLEGIEKIYIIDEQDKGGPTFVKGLRDRLRDLEYAGEVRVVQLQDRYGVKDPNALNVQAAEAGDLKQFRTQFQRALDAAILLQDWIDPSEAGDELSPRLVSADYVLNLPPVDWLIRGMLPVKSLTMVLGKENSGKSFLTLDWACRVATGLEWNGRPVEPGRVVYIASEGLPGYNKRLRAWLHHNGDSFYSDLVANLNFVTGTVDLMDVKRRDELLELVTSAQGVKMVVIDTLAESMPGADENTSKDMGVFLAAARFIRNQTGAAVIVVHHKPKSGEGSRGHSSLPGALDMRYEVNPDEADKNLIQLACTKARDVAKGEPTMLRLEVVQYGAEEYDSSCVLEPVEIEEPTHPGLNEIQSKIVDILAYHGRLSATALIKQCTENNISKSSFYRQIRDLEAVGALIKDSAGSGKPTYYTIPPAS